MSERGIADMIEDIYDFSMDAEQISAIIDCILEEVQQWQLRLLKKIIYPFSVDCAYVTVRKNYETKLDEVYVILVYDNDGVKEYG